MTGSVGFRARRYLTGAPRSVGRLRARQQARAPRLLEGGEDVPDEQLERLLLLRVREAVVAPEAELVDAHLLILAEPLDDLVGRADHCGLVQGLGLELGTTLELRLRAGLQEAVLG